MLLSSKSYLQNSRHNLSLNIGYGLGNPDKRIDFLYDRYPSGPVLAVTAKAEQTTFDDEYSIGLKYIFDLTTNGSFGFGVGYAKLVQDFLLPADGNGYFMQSIEPFFWRDTSQYHMIQIQPSYDVRLLKKSVLLGVNCSSISNISFRKHINSFNLSRNKTEYFATEFYTSAYGEYKRIRLDIGFRLLHWKYRDDAIANNGLRVDTYNPSKWRFQVSYQFWRSKNKE